MKLLVLATASLALLLGARAGKEGGGSPGREGKGMFDISDLVDMSQQEPGANRQGKGMFDIEDLVSSLPTQVGDTADSGDKPADRKRSIDNEEEEDQELDNLKPVETKRADGSFNINELIDWNDVKDTLTTNSAAAAGEEYDQDDIPGDHLNPYDFKAADDVVMDWDWDSADPTAFTDPTLSANLFEGDIDNVNLDALRSSMDSQTSRNAIRDSWRKWPDGVIPYVISGRFNTHERSVIAKAMKNYHDKTCIRFIPRTSERGYINIMKGSGCSSSVGRTGRMQQVGTSA